MKAQQNNEKILKTATKSSIQIKRESHRTLHVRQIIDVCVGELGE